MNNFKIGKDLETAVEAIEKAIFHFNPTLNNPELSIERNKTIIVDGVKHEIDIYVEINLGYGYRPIFIFECKNWNHSSVGKNEIIEFAEKIKVINAQQGFFIAKTFGRYSIAQARLNKKIVLLRASDNFKDIGKFPELTFVFRDRAKKDVKIVLYLKDKLLNSKETILPIDIQNINAYLNDNVINFKDYIMTIADKECEDHENFNTTKFSKYGLSTYTIIKELDYSNSNLIINNFIINKINMTITYEILRIEPKIKSKFIIEKRGRFIECEFDIPGDAKFLINMTTLIR